ncbi:MAG: rod shape-determining protein MreC [Minisyncoccia bacterium]
MKMQSFRRRRTGILPAVSIGTAVLGVVILVLLVLRFFVPDAFFTAARPLFSFGSFIAGSMEASEEVVRLRLENERLRALLPREAMETEGGGIVAGVLSRPPLTPYDVIIVAKGREAGVAVGDYAFSEGVPIGTVALVRYTSAHILLYSSAGRTNEGWIGEARLPLTITGRGGGAFSAEIPREAPVVAGDLVYLPGPGALLMGVVARIHSNATSPMAELSLRPQANPFTIDAVTLVKAPAP